MGTHGGFGYLMPSCLCDPLPRAVFWSVVLRNILSVLSWARWGPAVMDMFSDVEEHNIDYSLLLLVADALIASVILSGFSDVDELMVALGCRVFLDLFPIAQHDWTGGSLSHVLAVCYFRCERQ